MFIIVLKIRFETQAKLKYTFWCMLIRNTYLINIRNMAGQIQDARYVG